MNQQEQPQYRSVDKFDRMMGSLKVPDVTRTNPATIVADLPVIGAVQTYIVQTFRKSGEGDTIFLQYMDDVTHMRLVLSPQVADAIARQREALTRKVRKRVGKQSADARKARGEMPAFMVKGKKAKKGRKARAKGVETSTTGEATS